METMWLVGLLLALVVTFYIFRRKRHLSTIPGPEGLPLIGNVFQMDRRNPYKTMYKWAEQYGDIFKIKMFGQDVVVACSQEAIYEVLVTKGDEFGGRRKRKRTELFLPSDDILNTDIKPLWKILKKTSMSSLRQVGEKLKELEDITIDILEDLAVALTSYEGQEVDLQEDFVHTVSNITSLLTYGFKMTKEETKEFVSVVFTGVELTSPTGSNQEMDYFPFLRGPWYPKYREILHLKERAEKLFQELFARVRANFNGEIRCALDALIIESQSNTEIDLECLYSVALNLAAAGIVTTSPVIYFLVALFAKDPKFQAEAHAKVTEALGNRTPTVLDRFQIPYIESVLLEVLRYMSHVPVSLPHYTMTDTTLQGHHIPKGTMVLPNLWYLHHNEKLWDEPWKFKPKRFLDEAGQLVTADHQLRKQFLVFGAGRRVCAGESLARNRLFLFTVFLLQRFKFSPAEGSTIQTDARLLDNSFVLMPPSFKVKVDPRN